MLLIRRGQDLYCSRFYRHDETNPSVVRVVSALMFAAIKELFPNALPQPNSFDLPDLQPIPESKGESKHKLERQQKPPPKAKRANLSGALSAGVSPFSVSRAQLLHLLTTRFCQMENVELPDDETMEIDGNTTAYAFEFLRAGLGV